MVQIIDGHALAAEIRSKARRDVEELRARGVTTPGLAVVLIGEDPASQIYVRMKEKAAREVGIRSIHHELPATIRQANLLKLVDQLNVNSCVDGILIQLPLPAHIDAKAVLDRIVPGKDVDGFHPVNVGRLSIGSEGLVPCTPLGCIRLLETRISDFRGLHAVVIGKSNIVGKPVSLLLLEKECTVTVTHIETRGLPDIVRGADIVVAAAGSPELVRGDWVKPGAVVIDVGISRIVRDGQSRIVGDVAFGEIGHAAAATPVPGGVGPMTIACLIENTVRAARNRLATEDDAGATSFASCK